MYHHFYCRKKLAPCKTDPTPRNRSLHSFSCATPSQDLFSVHSHCVSAVADPGKLVRAQSFSLVHLARVEPSSAPPASIAFGVSPPFASAMAPRQDRTQYAPTVPTSQHERGPPSRWRYDSPPRRRRDRSPDPPRGHRDARREERPCASRTRSYSPLRYAFPLDAAGSAGKSRWHHVEPTLRTTRRSPSLPSPHPPRRERAHKCSHCSAYLGPDYYDAARARPEPSRRREEPLALSHRDRNRRRSPFPPVRFCSSRQEDLDQYHQERFTLPTEQYDPRPRRSDDLRRFVRRRGYEDPYDSSDDLGGSARIDPTPRSTYTSVEEVDRSRGGQARDWGQKGDSR